MRRTSTSRVTHRQGAPEPTELATPLVGREREFDAMLRFVEAHVARDAAARVLFVCGACGGGKTTTLRRVMAADFAASARLADSGVDAKLRKPFFHYLNCADLARQELIASVCAAVERACSGARQTKNSNSRNKRAGGAANIATLDAAFVALAAQRRPLLVLALDEAEFSRSPKVVEEVTLSAMAHGGDGVCVILITNSRSVAFLRPGEFEELTFGAYDVDHLAAIGAAGAADAASSGTTRAAPLRSSCPNTAPSASLPNSTTTVVLGAGAAEYAAKVAVTRYGADARKVLAMCRTAVARKVDAAAAAPCASSAAAAADASSSATLPQPPAKVVVGVADLVSSIVDAPTTNVPIIRTLPKQMLLILCCCLNYSRRLQERGAGPGLDVRGLYAMYQQLMRHLSVPPQSLAHMRESLSGLADYGLVTPVDGKGVFALVSRPDEIEVALRAEGKMYAIAGQVIAAV